MFIEFHTTKYTQSTKVTFFYSVSLQIQSGD